MTHVDFLEARAFAYSEFVARVQVALNELDYEHSLARSIIQSANKRLADDLAKISHDADVESARERAAVTRGVPADAPALPGVYKVRALSNDDVQFIETRLETCAVATGCTGGVFAQTLLLYMLPNLRDVAVMPEGEHSNAEGWVTLGGYRHPVDAGYHYAQMLAEPYTSVEEVPGDCGFLTEAMRKVIQERRSVQ